MTTPTFLFPPGDGTGHSVCLTAWAGGILLPRKETPTAYNFILGASGLVAETVVVSGTTQGFVGAIQDVSGRAWVLDYTGDVTLVSPTSQQALSLPTAASGDVFVGAALCNGHPYFVAGDGDVFTAVGTTITQVSPGFGARVNSVSSDGTKLYATLPASNNLATYTFSSQTGGTVSTMTTPLMTVSYVAGGNVSLPGSFSGSQNTGASNPKISGPVSGSIAEGAFVAVPGVTIVDTVEAASGLCSATFTCVSGTITVTGSRAIIGNGTNSVSVSDSFATIQTCAASLEYLAPSSVGADSIAVHVQDSFNNPNTLHIPLLLVAVPVQSAVAVGGWAASTAVSGASSLSYNSAANVFITTNTQANSILFFSGPEPDWSLTQAVSGTGAPTSAVWASTGEQVLVADPTNGKVQVFNFVSGELVPGQVLSVAGASFITTTPDQLTAFVVQPSANTLSILTNNLNTWALSQTVTLSTPTSCVVLSPISIAVGVNGGVDFVQKGGNTWAVTTAVTSLGFTPASVATDGKGTVFAAGGTGTGHLASVNTAGIIGITTWTGNSNAVYYEQGQLAVADSANALVRVFPALGTLTQQTTMSAPSGCTFIGTTSPSVWVCGVSGMAQDVFTAPYRLVPQKAGAVSVFYNGNWTTAQLEVGHQPSAGAWGSSGTFWSATLQNDLDQISTSGVVLNAGLLSSESVGLNGLAPSLGISAMQWSGGTLWAASVQNEALMVIAGNPPSGTIVAPTPPIGLNATAITSNSLTLNWTAPLTGTFPVYQVQFRVTGTPAWASFGGPVSVTTVAVTGLQPTTSYDFQVIASNSAGSATSQPFTDSTNNAAVSAPTGLTLSPASNTSLFASWQASNGTPPITYQPQYRIDGTTTWTSFGSPISTASVTITGLQPATSYDVQIVASNSAGSATTVPFATNSTSGIAPSAPGTLVIQSLGATTASFSWAASVSGSAPVEYQPQYELAVSGSWTSFGLPSTATSTTVSGLVASTGYNFQVIASNAFGSATSLSVSGTTAVTTSIWNPADETGMALTSSNLLATTDINTVAGVRSTSSKSSGLFYVELTANTSVEYEAFGIANASWSTSDPNGLGGPDNNSLGVTVTGAVFIGDVQVGSGDPWAIGSILGVALDFTHKRFWYRVNGNDWLGATINANPSVSGTGISFAGLNAGPYFMAFGGTLIGNIAGNQNSGTSQPVVSGPARATAILNRDGQDIPFDSNTSFWTRGIGSGASYGLITDADVMHLTGMTGFVNSNNFGMPIYFGTSNDPLVTVTCTDTTLPIPPQTLHIPIGATPAGPASGGDHHMNFYDSSQPGLFWSYFGCTLNNGVNVVSGITASLGSVWNTTGNGYTNSVSPGTDYNFGIGTITDYDLAQGVIKHALRCSLGPGDLHSPGATWTTNIPWPNTHEDFSGPTIYTGPITFGCTIVIPANTNIANAGLTQGGLMLATALQTYGMTIRDSGANGELAFYTTPENVNNPLITQMISDMPKIMPLLNIMRNQSVSGVVGTINGGGTYPTALPAVNADGGAGSVQLMTPTVTDTNNQGTSSGPPSVIPANAIVKNLHAAGTLAAWASGNFTTGQRCSSGGRAYQCTSPGSSTSAPTGTGSSINNGGTAIFTFLSSIDFTSVQAFWNSLANTTLTAPNALVFWNDGPILASNSTQIVNDFGLNITTSPANPIIMCAAPGEGVKGKNIPLTFNSANGVSIVTPSTGTGPGGGWILINSTNNVLIDGIQFQDPNPNSQTIFFNLGGNNINVQHFNINATSQPNFTEMFYLFGSNVNLSNFLIVDNKVDGSGTFTLKYDSPNGSGNITNGVLYVPNGVTQQASAGFCTLQAVAANVNVTNVGCFGLSYPIFSQNLNGATTARNCFTDQSSFQTTTNLGGCLFNQVLTNIFNSTSDFREKSGAATIGTGIKDVTDVPTQDDYFGRLRPTAWDMGAYQFNTATAGLCTLTLTCTTGTLWVPALSTVSGNFTKSVTIVDTLANCASELNQAYYNASDVLGQDTIVVRFLDNTGATNSISIPVTVAANDPAAKLINFGISSFSFSPPAGYSAWD